MDQDKKPPHDSTTPCPNFKQCGKDIWQKFKTSTKEVWITRYCNGPKKTDCVRRVLKQHNQNVSDALLPNGESLV